MSDQEHQEQVRLFAWAAREAETRPELGLLFAVPNGGRRDAVTGARLKAEGVKAGVPDVWLPVSRNGFHGLVIELKADKGRLTPLQRAWLMSLCEQGFYAIQCTGVDGAIKVITDYLEGMIVDSYG